MMNATTADQITVEWHSRTSNLQSLVEDFNNTIKESPQTKAISNPLNDIVDRIYPLVQAEIKRLEELSEEIKRRKDELSIKTWCTGPVSISENVRDLTIINGIAKVCAVAGFSVAVFENENKYAQWVGLSIFIVAEALDAFATVYEARLHLERAEATQLADINRDGIEHAKIFQSFLTKLKQAKETEERKKEAYHSSNESPFMDHSAYHLDTSDHNELDESIGDCLREYEELPKNYRKPEIQAFIISQLILGLPETHPLRIGLNRLKPLNPGENTSKIAGKPLTVRYLPNSPDKHRSHSSEDQGSESGWRVEELARSQSFETGGVEKEEISPEEMNEEYKKDVARYQNDVMQRFNLSRSIPYFITDNGWAISSKEGLKKIEVESQGINSPKISEPDTQSNHFKSDYNQPVNLSERQISIESLV